LTGRALSICALLLSCAAALSQDISPRKASVLMEPPAITTIDRGHAGTVELEFRVAPGFHINSNQPKQQYLKKTELKLDAPTDIVIGRIVYPKGENRSFPFDTADLLSVYSGDFQVLVTVHPLRTVLPAKYAVHGFLRYQACDNAACYPPKQLPVRFEVKVTKSQREAPKNPAQSPHVHS
jgi:Disulphide bond corrector protein DsbC